MIARDARLVFQLSALALGLLLVSAARGGETEEPVAARVNGTVISQSSVRDLLKSVIAGSPAPPSSEELEDLSRAALDSLVDLELLYQEAVARHVRVSQSEIDAEIEHTRARFRDASQFDAALQQSGLSHERLQQDTRKTLLADRLLEQVVWRDIRVSDADAKAFYDRNRREFEHPEQVRVRHLLLRAPPNGPEREATHKKAVAMRSQIAHGAAFADLARKSSDDGESAPRGGDLGYVGRGVLPAEVENAAFALPKGGLSDVIETPMGYHLVQVLDRKSPGVTDFSQVKDAIVQTLVNQEKKQRQAAFVADLRKKATIELSAAAPSATPETTPRSD